MIDFGYGVRLDTIDLAHLSQVREWRNNYAVWATCRQNDLITEKAHFDWQARIQSDPATKMYLIRSAEDVPVGVCGLTSIDLHNRRAEFSLYVGLAARGHGYGAFALTTLLAHGFATLGLNVIWGETFEGNTAAAMFKDLGFQSEGSRRQFYFRGGKFLDAHLYSMTADEWKNQKYAKPEPIKCSLPS